MTFGNYNAMAMEPMGHIAGMASAIISFVSGLMGVVLGGFAGRFYNGTLTPVALAFFAYGCAALLMSEWAESRR
jgi:DHA1 family bicyclomycin/chloramphenicol resistance-like MFS transporter